MFMICLHDQVLRPELIRMIANCPDGQAHGHIMFVDACAFCLSLALEVIPLLLLLLIVT